MVSTLSQVHAGWIIFGLCDLISQAILIYRCWIIWGCNIRIIVIPSILALTFLATWLAMYGSFYIVPDGSVGVTHLGYAVSLTSLAISLVVNGVVTGLIVLRILKVYWEARPTFEDQTLGIGTKGKIQSIIFIMIESGIAMFAIQTIGFVVCVLRLNAISLVIRITQMHYGIAPTIILVRLSMGLSFHDEKSMVETAASWRFASLNQDPISEMASIDIAAQERRDHIGVQQIDDIEIVNR
ncbi:hypothetical protein BYT27DRAFT_7205407 [Phlegmacium glaucopus]|nr:hypothetical protein BYT27DRAFT_7205407 [Phlegmacium glaucopus]